MRKLSLLAILVVMVIVSSCQNSGKSDNEENEITQIDSIPEPIIRLEYGLPADSFEIVRGTVKRNDFLGSILYGYGINYNIIDHLSRNYKQVFDVRKLKYGNHYAAFFSKDSARQLKYFVYEKSVPEFIVYDFTDTAFIYADHKPIRQEQKVATGVIESSLWMTMKDNGTNPMLAIDLSEIYAWSIDFFGIAKGDSFKVMYTEEFVDTISVGISEVNVASFTHLGVPYYAIPFMQDSLEHYFDERGASLRKAFLKAPLRFSRISSGFSNSRFHPVLKYYRPHHGIDYAAPSGTPVYSIGDGKIVARAYQKRGGGNYLKIKHNSVYTSVYMHLKGFAKGMYTGKQVKQGQLIGWVGATGLATGPHLDFRIYKNGSPVNPLKVKAPPVEPIKEENKIAFKLVSDSLLQILETHPNL